MTVKLSTTVNNIERDVHNVENKQLILKFYDFMKKIGTSERYQNNNLKATIAYSKFLDPSISFYKITEKSQIVSFLDTKMKSMEDDPDKRWITTWNHYESKIKIVKNKIVEPHYMEDSTPDQLSPCVGEPYC